MASTYSALKIQLMATGDNDGTWGDVTNQNYAAFEQMITGQFNVTFASADLTLTLTDSNALQPARALKLAFVGTTGGAPRNLIIPAGFKQYLVSNFCADAITVKTATGAGTIVPPGQFMALFCDGLNTGPTTTYAPVMTIGNLGLTNPLSAGNGGTGAAGLTSGALLKGNGTSPVLAAVAGTDYAKPDTASNWSALQAFLNLTGPNLRTRNSSEVTVVLAASMGGTYNYDAAVASIVYDGIAPAADIVLNFRGSASLTFDALTTVGDTATYSLIFWTGATTFRVTAVQFDGVTIAGGNIVWGAAGGYPAVQSNTFAVYTFAVLKQSSASYIVFANLSKFFF